MNAKPVVLLALLPLLFSMAGCTTNGYITSSVGTILGLDVSENPQTQVPHIKFGYARHGMYYVPTGKTAYGDPRRAEGYQNQQEQDPARTPTVVSEIFVHSKFLTDIVISEKFAIGPGAGDSAAARSTFSSPAPQQVAAGSSTVEGPRIIPAPTRAGPTLQEQRAAFRQPRPASRNKAEHREDSEATGEIDGVPPTAEMGQLIDSIARRLPGRGDDQKFKDILLLAQVDESKVKGRLAATRLFEAYKKFPEKRAGISDELNKL